MSRAWGPLLLSLGGVATCGLPASSGAGPPLVLQPCHLEGLNDPTLCGSWSVWEDRGVPDRPGGAGRRLDLNVAVVPAVKPNLHPDPVFFLAGGPGQGATEVAASVMPLFGDVHEGRDIVFVDQRGTGGSNRLGCDPPDAETLEGQLHTPMDGAWLTECRDTLDADLRFYTTPIAMDDLDEVRAALGYDRVNLYGGSYGTRAALVYMRGYGDHVRTAVLDGVAPPSMELFLHFPADGQAALDATFRDCAAAPTCAAAFPGVADAFTRLLTNTPYDVSLHHPRTGVAEAVRLDRRDIGGIVRGMLYSPMLASLLPLDIGYAERGLWDPLVAQGSAIGGAWQSTGGSPASWRAPSWRIGLDAPEPQEDRGLALGMLLSVACTEDIPRITADARAAAASDTFLGDSLIEEVMRACAEWPRGTLPAGYHDPVVSDVPTLLLSGGLDPVTPPRWGAEAARHLTHAVHGVAPAVGHNVLPYGCAPDLMAQLYDSGGVEGLDVSCLAEIQRPPFFVDLLGPAL